MQENGLDIPSKTISKNLLSYKKRYVHHSCTSRIKICRIYLLWPFYLTREKIYAHHSCTILVTFLSHKRKDICSSFKYKYKVYENISTLTFFILHERRICSSLKYKQKIYEKRYLLWLNGYIYHGHLRILAIIRKHRHSKKNQNCLKHHRYIFILTRYM